MNEKEILEQLNKFQQIKPDAAWKKSNREILLSQISNSSQPVEYSWFENFRIQLHALTSVSQPAMAVVLIMLFIISGGTFGIRASRDTKPGDSLYIAKRVSEKAQLAVAFDQNKKMELGREFAGNRVEELSQVLAGKNTQMTEADRQELSKLVDNLKKDIINVKSQDGQNQTTSEDNVLEEDNNIVFTAGAGKDAQGLQVSDAPVVNNSEASTTAKTTDNDPQAILQQAKELLQQSDYDAAISKLDEATKIVSGDNGEVKGETASSTDTQ